MSQTGVVTGIVLFVLPAAALAQPGTPTDAAAARTQALHDSAARFALQLETAPLQQLVLHPQPLFRWSNPVSGIEHGIVSLWVDAQGRPAVLAQVFLNRDGSLRLHEFQSVAGAALSMSREGEVLWRPGGPGAEVLTLPGAPPPAGSRSARALQARRLAAQFKASVEFKLSPGDAQTTRYELRLRPRPVYEYGDDEAPATYGALFAFDQGTNPEVWLLLEVHSTEAGPEWRYALAPQTAYHVRAQHSSGAAWQSANQQQHRKRNDRGMFWVNDVVESD